LEGKTNTLYVALPCPFCQEKVISGVGFRVGAITNKRYQLGDKLEWTGQECRPAERPSHGNLTTVGYFNCDNVRCSTWQDCYPEVQQAIVVIREDIITDVQPAPPGDYKRYEIMAAE
jgi:hypothetical protein